MSGFVRGIIVGGLLALAGVVAALYLVISSGVINPGADEPIPPLERWAAKTSLRAYLKRATPKVVNPVKLSEANLKDAVDLYTANCAACHGDAQGRSTNITVGLYKKPNIFAGEDWSQDEDGLVYWFINHGVKLTGMPAYNKTLKEEDMWKLVLLIKNIKKLPPSVKDYWNASHVDVSFSKQ